MRPRRSICRAPMKRCGLRETPTGSAFPIWAARLLPIAAVESRRRLAEPRRTATGRASSTGLGLRRRAAVLPLPRRPRPAAPVTRAALLRPHGQLPRHPPLAPPPRILPPPGSPPPTEPATIAGSPVRKAPPPATAPRPIAAARRRPLPRQAPRRRALQQAALRQTPLRRQGPRGPVRWPTILPRRVLRPRIPPLHTPRRQLRPRGVRMMRLPLPAPRPAPGRSPAMIGAHPVTRRRFPATAIRLRQGASS